MCTTKTCTKCGEDKPATLEFYRKNYDPRSVKAFIARCRACNLMQYRMKHPPKKKVCPTCGISFTGRSTQLYCVSHMNDRARERRLSTSKERVSLGDNYVKATIAAQLSKDGIKISLTQITPELIETKRKQLWLTRERNKSVR